MRDKIQKLRSNAICGAMDNRKNVVISGFPHGHEIGNSRQPGGGLKMRRLQRGVRSSIVGWWSSLLQRQTMPDETRRGGEEQGSEGLDQAIRPWSESGCGQSKFRSASRESQVEGTGHELTPRGRTRSWDTAELVRGGNGGEVERKKKVEEGKPREQRKKSRGATKKKQRRQIVKLKGSREK